MNTLRAIVRLLAFVTWSVLMGLAALLVQAPVTLAPRVGVPMKRAVARLWARGVAAIIGLRIVVEGDPPAPPYVLVSNHLGYVDIVTIMAVCPSTFVAKSEVAGWPLLGQLSRVANTIFVDRESRKDVVRVNALIDETLDRGEGLVMFPEGTSSRGVDVLPFRSSLLEPAVRSGRPVNFASLHYRTPAGAPPADMSVCWWGDMTFGRHFWELLQLPGIEGSVSFGDGTVAAGTRHDLARDLRQAVASRFTPVTTAGGDAAQLAAVAGTTADDAGPRSRDGADPA